MKTLTQHTRFAAWMVAMVLFLVSCAKDGVDGLDGINGERGADGSMIYSGTAEPPANLGAEGDYYFRTSNARFYGPKTADGWGAGVSLRGAAGSKILSGTAVPAANVGVNGDYYLRTSNYMLYGPKTADGWGSGLNLRGATGPQGPAGTANVIYGNWTNFPAQQTTTTSFGVTYRSIRANVSQINQNIIDRGTVLVYVRFIGSTDVQRLLPIQISNSGSTGSQLFEALISVGGFDLRWHHPNSITTTPAAVSTSNQYRFVIIPGGVQATASLQGIDMNNYNEVKVALGIED